jgi:hypothetical protein
VVFNKKYANCLDRIQLSAFTHELVLIIHRRRPNRIRCPDAGHTIQF